MSIRRLVLHATLWVGWLLIVVIAIADYLRLEQSPGAGRLPVARAGSVPPAVAASAVLAPRLQTFAVNAFVVPVLDDSDEPRFTDLHRTTLCAEQTEVKVNGQPVIAGDLVPPGAFVLHWDLALYCPFGSAGPQVDGRIEVLVFRDDEAGLQVILRPESLTVYEPTLAAEQPEPVVDWRVVSRSATARQ